MNDDQLMALWSKASFVPRLVASSIKISEAAGGIIKNVMLGGDLKIIDKSEAGQPADLQTEADRRAQFCIVQSLQKHFTKLKIIGEEDITSACPEIEAAFDVTPLQLNCSEEISSVKEEDVVVWVDPLDGTSEVALALKNKNAALLEQVTVLIGVAHKGKPIAGIIHQPYFNKTGRTIWAIHGCGIHGIIPASTQSEKVVVTTRSHLSDSVISALDALKAEGLADQVLKVGGAGYKVIKIIEGCAAYVFASAGCKKWDTCAVEAVLQASGGNLTDISGRQIVYSPHVQKNNTGGVLATANWVSHQNYVESIPQALKDSLPEFCTKAKQ
ncbi:unnamed protein product [Auanema sp. JU1783]|nr:unnamed protein product [Auanema sp. JU1783]